ncbi:uncharacterized protein F4807DRAFT_458126 [Annulohypoxylon truncatum]|uniref:uncharacterized protein n=1 Tax=Annulohypoxylon truncatum TaxID=327061 RepID=UPI002008307E|nr:uncharacterized protein F4807DRAFT_458126 [Annulohypoxylon truncatum]KAI1211921.1 hypothetical protein F4807DRAFT_458126 [Annulohypoxylon truncatum]
MNQSDYTQIPAVPPPAGQTSNFVDPPSQEATMIAVSTVMMALTLAFVSLRLYTSFRVTRKPGLEDWLCIVALVLSFGHISGVLLLSHKTRHMWDVPLSWFLDDYWKIRLFANLFQSFAYFSSRLPILMLYLRIFGETRGFRIACYVCLALVFAVSLVAIPLLSYYCAPFPSEGWHSLAVFARCKNILNWAIIQGGLDIFLDLYIFILPLPIVLRLHMPKRQKLGVLAVFLTGFLAVLASVVGFYYRYRLTYTNDVNWNEGIYICTIIVEINIATICSCMPACYAFFRHITEQRSSSSPVHHVLQPELPNTSSTFFVKQDSPAWLPELSLVELRDVREDGSGNGLRDVETEPLSNDSAPHKPGSYHVV